MEEISMRGVNLEQTKAGVEGALRGFPEGIYDR